MRRVLALVLLLLAMPAWADMFQDGSNAKLPEAVINLAKVPGAVGDGVTDDTAAFTAYVTSMAGRVIKLDGTKKYRLTTPITIPSNTTLDCQASPGTTVWGLGGYAVGGLGGLRLEAGATVTLSAGARLQHCSVLRAGLTWPQANPSAYSGGPAITVVGGNAADVWLDDLLIIGFETCVNVNGDRLHLINLEADCTNAYKIYDTADTSYLHNLRAWPWGTWTCATQPSCIRRSGTAFLIEGKHDHTVTSDLLAFGWNVGIDMVGVTCCGMSFDGTVWLDTNTTALRINNTVSTGAGVDFYFASIQDVGGGVGGVPSIVFNNAGSRVHIGRLSQWKDTGTTDCVQNNGTELHIKYLNMYGCQTAINTTAGSTTVLSGAVRGITTVPYFKVPGTGTPNFVNVSIGPQVIGDAAGNLLPAGIGTFVYQNGEKQNIGLGTWAPDQSLVVSGAGAGIGIYDTTGNKLVLGPPQVASGGVATLEVVGNNAARIVANGVEVFRVNPAGTMSAAGIVATALPANCTGQPSKTLWNDTGTVKVCP